MKKPTTDAELVAAARSGSIAAFEYLVLRHQDRLYRQAMGYLRSEEDARDALQDAFLKAFAGLDALHDDSRFPSWICRILSNVCLNSLRDARRRRDLKESVAEASDIREHPGQPAIRNAVLKELLARIPRKSTQMFVLYYLGGYSIREVAQRVGATPGSVKQRLYRARKQLQEEVIQMAKDDETRHDLPDGFVAKTVARLLEQGRRSRLYMKLDEARARFGEALDVCPDHPGAMMELERTFDPIDGPSEDDTATLRRAAKAHPDSIDVAMALTAALRQDREQQAEAIENCMKLCNRRLAGVPDDVDALIAKAQMYLWKRDLDAMERAARRAVALAPNSQHSLNYLALSLARQNRWEEAFPIYETIYGLDNKTVWAYISLRQMGTYLGFHEGDWERAAGVQEKVWDLTGRPHEAGNLIYFYGRAGQLDHARALFRKVRDFPHPARVYEVVAGAS